MRSARFFAFAALAFFLSFFEGRRREEEEIVLRFAFFFFFLSLSFCGADADRAGVAGEGSKELEFGTVLTCGAR